jgi:hypothetical protein
MQITSLYLQANYENSPPLSKKDEGVKGWYHGQTPFSIFSNGPRFKTNLFEVQNQLSQITGL